MIPHDPQLVCKRRYLDHFTDHTFFRVYIFIKITEPEGPAVFREDSGPVYKEGGLPWQAGKPRCTAKNSKGFTSKISQEG